MMSDQTVSVGKTKGFTLPRAVDATIVPAGQAITLPAGDRVTLLQALGATATVTTSAGEMARLSRQDSIDFGFIAAPDVEAVASAGRSVSTAHGKRPRPSTTQRSLSTLSSLAWCIASMPKNSTGVVGT